MFQHDGFGAWQLVELAEVTQWACSPDSGVWTSTLGRTLTSLWSREEVAAQHAHRLVRPVTPLRAVSASSARLEAGARRSAGQTGHAGAAHTEPGAPETRLSRPDVMHPCSPVLPLSHSHGALCQVAQLSKTHPNSHRAYGAPIHGLSKIALSLLGSHPGPAFRRPFSRLWVSLVYPPHPPSSADREHSALWTKVTRDTSR